MSTYPDLQTATYAGTRSAAIEAASLSVAGTTDLPGALRAAADRADGLAREAGYQCRQWRACGYSKDAPRYLTDLQDNAFWGARRDALRREADWHDRAAWDGGRDHAAAR